MWSFTLNEGNDVQQMFEDEIIHKVREFKVSLRYGLSLHSLRLRLVFSTNLRQVTSRKSASLSSKMCMNQRKMK